MSCYFSESWDHAHLICTYYFLVSPQTSILSINQTYPAGVNATIVCSSNGGPNNSYQWQVNGSDIEGAVIPVLELLDVQSSDGGEYTCMVSNAAGSQDASTFLYISPFFITQPVDTQAVNGTSVNLTCEGDAFPSPEYQWGRSDGVSIREGIITYTSILIFNPVMFGDEGDYYCNVSSLDFIVHSEVATLSGKHTFTNNGS